VLAWTKDVRYWPKGEWVQTRKKGPRREVVIAWNGTCDPNLQKQTEPGGRAEGLPTPEKQEEGDPLLLAERGIAKASSQWRNEENRSAVLGLGREGGESLFHRRRRRMLGINLLSLIKTCRSPVGIEKVYTKRCKLWRSI